MMTRLTVTGFISALACTAALAGAALAEGNEWTPPDEIGIDDTWDGVVVDDPGAGGDDGIFETGVVDGDEGEPGEYVEDGGDPVAYGPDDCIDCSFAPTIAFDGEARGGAGNQRGSVGSGNGAMARDGGGSGGGSGRPACGSLKPHDMRPCDN